MHMLRCAVEKLTKEGNGDDDYGETLEATDYVGVSERVWVPMVLTLVVGLVAAPAQR